MTRRFPLVVLLVALACSGVAAPSAAAQSGEEERSPTELWKEYPLGTETDRAPAAPAEPAEPAPSAPAPAAEEDDGGSILPTIGLGLLALLLVSSAVVAAARLRRRRAADGVATRAAGPHAEGQVREAPPARAKPVAASAKAAPPEAKPASTRAEPAPANAKAAPTKVQPAPKPGPAKAQPAPTKAKPAPAYAQPGPTKAQPAPADVKPAPTKAKPAPTKAKPGPTKAKPAPAYAKPAPADAKPAPPEADPAPARAEPAPARARAAPPEAKPAKAEQARAPARQPRPRAKPASAEGGPAAAPTVPAVPAPSAPAPPAPAPPAPKPRTPATPSRPPVEPAPEPPSRPPVEPAAAPPTTPPAPTLPTPPFGAPPPAAPTSPTPLRAEPAQQRTLGYTTFSSAERSKGPETRLVNRQLEAACAARGLVLHNVVGDLESHSVPDLKRPGLVHALERLEAGEAACLMVTSLDRLSRSAASLGTVVGWLDQHGIRLVVVDIDLDTGTDAGRLAASALVTLGQLEQTKLERRTRKGLEAARDGRRSSGRPAVADKPLLKRRIADMRANGMTLQAIADELNREGIPTLRGGAEWRPSSVQAAAGYKRPKGRT